MHIAPQSLWWLAAGGVGYGARYARTRWRAVHQSVRQRGSILQHELDQVADDVLLEAQTLYGYNPHSLVSLSPQARVWKCAENLHPASEGIVIYRPEGRVWLASGEPLASPERAVQLAQRFQQAARHRGRIAAFAPATTHFAGAAVATGDFRAVKIGASPYFDLTSWAPRGDRAKKLRAGMNQARRAGVKVEFVEKVSSDLIAEAAELCRQWLATRRASIGFDWLFALDPFRHAVVKRFFTARDGEGNLVGFLAASPIPLRQGWYLEDVLRGPETPRGTADLLVAEALTMLAAQGAKLATLGTCLLAREGAEDVPTSEHQLTEQALRLAAGPLGRFYNFEGLRRFKAKFVPSWWESEYALGPCGMMAPPQIALAVVRAIAPRGIVPLLAAQFKRGATATEE